MSDQEQIGAQPGSSVEQSQQQLRQQEIIGSLKGKGVNFAGGETVNPEDLSGQVVPSLESVRPENVDKLLEEKVASSLDEVNQKIREAIEAGKFVLYLPGSYDLVHAGHAYYVQQCIEKFLALLNNNRPPKQREYTKEDIYVVVLADSDELISKVKEKKFVGEGGNEKERRPVESAPTRLACLLGIPSIDLVGIVPHTGISPETFTQLIDRAKQELESNQQLPLADKDQISNALNALSPSSNGIWPVQLWQLLVHAKIMDRVRTGRVTRMVSHNDTNYLEQIRFLMKLVGIYVQIIQDDNIGSTSEIVKRFNDQSDKPWEEIRRKKEDIIKN